jgi:hypothetical protein
MNDSITNIFSTARGTTVSSYGAETVKFGGGAISTTIGDSEQVRSGKRSVRYRADPVGIRCCLNRG